MSPALMSSISDWIFRAHRWACHTYTTAGSVRLFRCIVTKQAITGIGITLSQVSYSLRHLLSLSHTHKHIPTTKQCLCIYKFIYNDINSQTISLSLSNNTHTLSVPPPTPPFLPLLHTHTKTTQPHSHTHTHMHTHDCPDTHTHACTRMNVLTASAGVIGILSSNTSCINWWNTRSHSTGSFRLTYGSMNRRFWKQRDNQFLTPSQPWHDGWWKQSVHE